MKVVVVQKPDEMVGESITWNTTVLHSMAPITYMRASLTTPSLCMYNARRLVAVCHPFRVSSRVASRQEGKSCLT